MTNPPTGTVTFLLTDIEGSTRLWEQNSKAMTEALAWHDDVMRAAIENNGGYIFTTAGDAFCAAFPDPMQAAAAAVEGQEVVGSKDWGELGVLRVRMAIDTGIAEERGGDYFGPPVNRASRIMKLAAGGEVLASHTTADLLKHHLDEGIRIERLGERQLKDVAEPEIVFNIEFGPATPPPAPPRRRRRMVMGLAGLGLVGVIAAVLMIAKPFSSAETATLTGFDAAYADWIDEEVEGCGAALNIGFGEAAAYQVGSESPQLGTADVDASLGVNCPEKSWVLYGVVPAADCIPPPEMVTLESATVTCDLTISGDGAEADLKLALEWTATGGVATETIPNSDPQHTRMATLVGDVMMQVTTDDDLVALFSGFQGFGDSDLVEARMVSIPGEQIIAP